jgi:hypothetical protein
MNCRLAREPEQEERLQDDKGAERESRPDTLEDVVIQLKMIKVSTGGWREDMNILSLCPCIAVFTVTSMLRRPDGV